MRTYFPMGSIALIVGVLSIGFGGSPRVALAQESGASQPDPRAEQMKWQRRIVFYNDESTGEWSLRILDKDVDQQRIFHMRELWRYNRQTKHWDRISMPESSAKMFPPGKKPRDPQADPTDNQVLAVLPIDPSQIGIFYAKWSVDDVNGTTMCMIGAPLVEHTGHRHPDPGLIYAIVPIDKTHSEGQYIPDPKIACGGDE